MKKILLICSRSLPVYVFRAGLVKDLKKKGFAVSIVALDNDYEELIKKWDVDFHYIYQNNRSTNPFEKYDLFNKYKKIIKKVNPDIVFTFQITPNTIGALAAHSCGIKNIYSMVEGAGDVFIFNSIKWKIIRLFTSFLLKRSFKHIKRVFFISKDDKNEFVLRKILKEKQCFVIPGIGVDVSYFKYVPIKNYNRFIMIARMMPTKGVFEYCKAARIIKTKYPNTIFDYLGEEFTLKTDDIKEYIDDGTINYLGYKQDIRPYLEDAFVNILPSYREGFGLTIAEAGAVGRASIASRTNGCIDAVEDQKTGLLFENKNVDDLVLKIEFALKNKKIIENMGIEARKLAEKKYNRDIIDDMIINELM